MAKAEVVVGNARVQLDGTPEEIAALLTLLTADGRPSPPARPKRAQAQANARRPARRSGPMAHVRELVESGFFETKRELSEIQAKLEERAHIYPVGSISPTLFRLVKSRELRRLKEDGGWKYVNA